MLRGSYSQINNFSKFILLIILVISFLLFSTLLGILVLVPFFGTGVISLLSTPDYSNIAVVNAMKAMQILNMAGGLLLPAVIYLWLCYPGIKTDSVFNKPFKYLPIALSALLIVISQPLIGWTSELNSYLSLPEGLSFVENWMKNAETQGEMITEAFLSTTSMSGLLVNIFMVAILPAFAEEILFRGALARLFKDWTKNVHLAVFLSAFLFAAIHMQFYGFLPRFLLGTALGYLYFWSGSLWLPIVAHFTNNFLSVIVEFLFRKGMIHINAENFGVDNATWLTAISILGVTGILFSIYNLTSRQNKEC
ncbi:MAG: CPBP family intramembrane metalloprotease [Bacteroidales bacterium]|nr:CPBP family intramembrane metalloprotease [Bacteroidales bacterium]